MGTVGKIIRDKGGMIYDKKTKSWWFRLKDSKVDLPPPPYEAYQQGVGGVNIVKIWQKAHNEFFYLVPDSISQTEIIRDGKLIPIAKQDMKVVEGDVAYWNQLRKREDKKLFDPEGLAMKLLPYIGIFLMFMLVIFLSYFITQHWGEFAQAAQALKEAAQALRDAQGIQVVQ